MSRFSIDPTPNPDSLKFSLREGTFIESGLKAYSSPATAADDPLADALFQVDGVSDVMIVPTFLTVTKRPDADWNQLLPAIEKVLNTHLQS